MATRKIVAANRTTEILQDLLRDGDVSVDQLAAQLSVSKTTVRRSLRKLQSEGLLKRQHGGAVSVETLLYEPFRYDADFLLRERFFADEKRRIGIAASDLVRDGDTVALSAGTSTTQVARALKWRQITIVTNALNIAMELARSNTLRVVLTGGFVSGGWFSVLGPRTIEDIREADIDIAFVGVDGIDLTAGLTSAHADEADVNRCMITMADRKIVVADRSKFNKSATSQICTLADIDQIITDHDLPDDIYDEFGNSSIRIVRV